MKGINQKLNNENITQLFLFVFSIVSFYIKRALETTNIQFEYF